MGFRGKVQFAVCRQISGLTGIDKGIEADNNEFNFDCPLQSSPMLANLTLVGTGPAIDGAKGIHFRRGTGGKVINSIVAGWHGTGLDIEHEQTFANCAGTAPSLLNCDVLAVQEPGVGFGQLLVKASPNPIVGATRLSFSLPRDQDVRVEIYDVAGRLVQKLADGPMGAGLTSWTGTRRAARPGSTSIACAPRRGRRPGSWWSLDRPGDLFQARAPWFSARLKKSAPLRRQGRRSDRWMGRFLTASSTSFRRRARRDFKEGDHEMNPRSLMVRAAGMFPAVALLVLASIIPARTDADQDPGEAPTQGPGHLQGDRSPAASPTRRRSQPLSFANVVAFRTTPGDTLGVAAGGCTTGDDGGYTLKVAPGTYRVVFSYVTYQSITRQNIAVAAGRRPP